MQFTDILLLVVVIVAIVVFVLYMLNRWAYKKMDSQSSMIEKTKTTQQAVSYTHLTLPTTPYV